MLLGIDVGGTFTDAVIVEDGRLTAKSKCLTTQRDLLEGVLASIDKVLTQIDKRRLTRVSLSTTIVTNALVEGKTDKAGLLMMTGPGMDYHGLLPEQPYLLTGYIDYRGREAMPPSQQQVLAACRQAGRELYAVAGKFAVRNPALEQQVAGWIQEAANPVHISLSSQASGTLNLWRRANSAYYNAAVWRHFGRFADAVEAALAQRDITAPLFILKADGGTLPLAAARRLPVEAVFTGPAASVLGIMALAQPSGEAVSLDIGGTTTDIALWRDGLPLFAQHGARIAGYPTSVQAFRLKSIGIGGDSWVRRVNGSLVVGPERKGAAMAAGGSEPTLSDAMIALGLIKFGDADCATQAVKQLAAQGQSITETAQTILQHAAQQITLAIQDMIAEQASEPVYRVNDIVNQNVLKPAVVIGIGGAAQGLAPIVAEQMGVSCTVPNEAEVANAVGAAVAKPTVDITLRADTAQGYYTVAELGLMEKLPGKNMRLEQIREMAADCLRRRAAQTGIDAGNISAVYEEEFNLIRGFNTIGKVFTCRLQVKPGVLTDFQGGRGKL